MPRGARRHGGDRQRCSLKPEAAISPEPREDLLALDQALDELTTDDPLRSNLVKLRYFAGMTLAQAAAALNFSERTASRHWTYARAWLRQAVEVPKKISSRVGAASDPGESQSQCQPHG